MRKRRVTVAARFSISQDLAPVHEHVRHTQRVETVANLCRGKQLVRLPIRADCLQQAIIKNGVVKNRNRA
jgi:hypothetical protein